MTYIDGSRFHPTCDPTVPENTVIAERAEAHRLQVAGQDQAATSAPDDYGLAKNIVNRAALSMRVFSANDVRLMDSRWEQLHSPVRGSAFTYACRQGWISRTYGPGDKSSSRATHGHEVHRYESHIFVYEFRSGLVSGTRRSA